jgi:hypothetical protein
MVCAKKIIRTHAFHSYLFAIPPLAKQGQIDDHIDYRSIDRNGVWTDLVLAVPWASGYLA